MSPILFFIIFFIYTGVGKIFLQINSAAVAFIDILIAVWEGLRIYSSVIPGQLRDELKREEEEEEKVYKWRGVFSIIKSISDIYGETCTVLAHTGIFCS